MSEFLAMGGYAEFVWSVYALGAATLVYNVVSARRRLRNALEDAALNATRIRNRRRTTDHQDGSNA